MHKKGPTSAGCTPSLGLPLLPCRPCQYVARNFPCSIIPFFSSSDARSIIAPLCATFSSMTLCSPFSSLSFFYFCFKCPHQLLSFLSAHPAVCLFDGRSSFLHRPSVPLLLSQPLSPHDFFMDAAAVSHPLAHRTHEIFARSATSAPEVLPQSSACALGGWIAGLVTLGVLLVLSLIGNAVLFIRWWRMKPLNNRQRKAHSILAFNEDPFDFT